MWCRLLRQPGMCETKRVAWRPEVPEHAKMGSIGGSTGPDQGPRPPGNRKKTSFGAKKIEKTFF